MFKPHLEVADIFRKNGSDYRQLHKLSITKRRVMRAIEICRTTELGGHISKCDNCGVEHPAYNSCRNRHCPKCQFNRTEKWLEARKQEILPIQYFHVVFTIPDKLNPIVRMNQKKIYNIFFKSVSETLLALGKDSKHLGAQIGAICVLHTWGQNLMFHPHIHCIVTGGGLSENSKQWVASKPDFFISVLVLAKLFRGKFLAYLKTLHCNQELQFNEKAKHLSKKSNFSKYLDDLYKLNWIVYAKPPFNGATSAIDYLGRYTHKVAISNHRLVKFHNGKVTFKYRDYKDSNKSKLMTLEANEFIRRFLLHVLPNKFVKIRYYGILCNKKKKTNLQLIHALLNSSIDISPEFEFTFSCKDFNICPACKKGQLIKTFTLPTHCRAP
jgi:hypothetical protein